ncbi:hypothetical protein [Acidithiobacillus ferriphilus]|uniref:hypothetical protein n=1 Tax=Acidithiobacillus ferriphilus TaxID=1689834 RepID=UPI001C0780B9|nr:hypothetical protein [Acidithiobacillus ferriphilus]MBU2828104.1 hypothetical protein [Acidithiobacillus ferriphilus]MBU2846263.1 hypothetical protein [Acidithiobacillus ferriphilus]
MHTIGIDDNGRVYQRQVRGPNWETLASAPLIIPATLVEQPDNDLAPKMTPGDIPGIIFREYAYDPLSRVRQGWFYWLQEQGQPFEINTDSISGPPGIRAYIYQSTSNNHGPSPREWIKVHPSALVLLGRNEKAFSIWSVVNMEANFTGDLLITMHARRTFGILPQTRTDLILGCGQYGEEVLRRLDILADETHRAGPFSVVNAAREAAAAIFIAYLDRPGEDLGALVKDERLKQVAGVKSMGELLARYHARDKPAERTKRKMPVIVDRDAELAVLCVGTILRDIGWAEWSPIL